jgi:hypothetical protein
MSQAFPMHGSRVSFFMKDFCFLFYPGDYLRDTQCLSPNAQVAYDRIMCEHMRNICIRHNQFQFFTKRLSEDEVSELKSVLVESDDGFHIEWVMESINKRKAYSESRRQNRTKKTSKSHDEHMITYDNHMEIEIEKEIEIEDENSKKNKLKINREKKSEWQNEKKKEYIIQHYPSLLQMQKPITEEQLMNLIAEYGKEAVMKKCEALENKKDAAKKYKSAYMTLKSWLRDFPDIRESKKQSNEDKVKKAMEILQSGTQLIPEFK